MQFLLIDDNPYDRELIRRSLAHIFPTATYVEVLDQAGFEEAASTLDYDIVFTDYQLKWTTGLELLKTLRQRSPDLPVIMVTDTGSEEIATEAMKNGLNDYLLKTHLTRLPIAVEECLQKVRMRQERRSLEAQLQKAQKMESLGLLVSGVAHDFNNTLGAITGYAQRGMQALAREHPLYEVLQHIQERSAQGARMTNQLLAFARGTPLDPALLSLDELLDLLCDFLQRLLGPMIELKIESDGVPHMLYADRTQIEQILVNLAMNARDAMPDGGTVTVAVSGVVIEETTHSLQTDLLPGSYVLLKFTDTGMGMDEQVQARLFEPFFTTKDIGRGTGLGLAVVYGIVKQHHGFIQLQSSPKQGTSFSLYFPLARPEEETLQEPLPPKNEVEKGSETLLIVEDDPDIQLLMSEFLRDCGYTLLLSSNGEEGRQLFEQHASAVALVIADIMMPKMKGKEFQEYIRKQHPNVKILVVSGYQEMYLQQRQLLDATSAFLQKPFDLDELAARVRALLESRQ